MSNLESRVDSSSSAERTPLPLPASVDARVVDAWCEWLVALASDAEAALAAAIAYRELSPSARDQWLTVLEQDAPRLEVPTIALYAPLLSVESDPARRQRITQSIDPADAHATPRFAARGLAGIGGDGTRVAVLVVPLYLDFTQVVACGYRKNAGFSWVRHDPIVLGERAPRSGDTVGGVCVESTPLKTIIDDLSLAILAQRREGREIPEALRVFADMFGPVSDSVPPSA
ncbi:MAG TPA: hypothetical protein VFZ53_31845 [Polyangiaceae bacterium]